tara:strand:- start:1046 stop:1771 length:726 start_codon:yes stop_codon:yes gene_type:complete
MFNPEIGAYIAVISHARSRNVERQQSIVGPATWYTGLGEEEEYKKAGAAAVVEVGPLCESRNAALKDAWDRGYPCIELSDDLTNLEVLHMGEWQSGKEKCFIDCAKEILRVMTKNGAYLGGIAPTANKFYYHAKRPLHTNAFIVGDFIVVRDCGLWFDEAFTLKEDYDYTLQHIQKFGLVVRANYILASFQHRKNAGGVVEYRNQKTEQENILRLKKKWGKLIKDNPRRPNEVLMDVRSSG